MRPATPLLAAGFAACASLAATEPAALIHCGRLIDGRAEQAATEVDVQVVGGRIAAIGKGLAAPPGAVLLVPSEISAMTQSAVVLTPCADVNGRASAQPRRVTVSRRMRRHVGPTLSAMFNATRSYTDLS